MDKQVLQFLEENKEKIEVEVLKMLPILNIEKQLHGLQGMVEYAYGYIDAVHEKLDMASKTTCSSGCSFCCYSDINMSFSEATYIYSVIDHLKIPYDKALLKKQNSKKFHKLKYADKACVMLDKDGSCKIYDHRPVICRLWNSTSEPKECDSKSGYNMTRTARIVECWAMSLALYQIDMTNNINSKEIFLHKILDL